MIKIHSYEYRAPLLVNVKCDSHLNTQNLFPVKTPSRASIQKKLMSRNQGNLTLLKYIQAPNRKKLKIK